MTFLVLPIRAWQSIRAATPPLLLCTSLPCFAQEAPVQAPDAGSQPDTIAAAPPPADDAEHLAKQLANPVASLISVPFQENIDFGLGPSDGVKSTLNIQPVVPLSLGSNWNVIVRTILPVVYQADVSAPGAHETGLGDTLQSFFFSPKAPGPGGIIWGVGPAVLYPTATDRLLGNDKWGLGPTAVLLKQSGKATYGILANHVWSVAGSDTRSNVSSTFVQPFFSYTTAKATTYVINTETSYDWVGDHWVVPINISVAQLTKMGKQRVQFGIGARYYVEKPAGGPDWGIRLILTLLFPE